MDEMDDLLDSLMERKKPENVNYIKTQDDSNLEIRQTATEGQGVFAKKTLPATVLTSSRRNGPLFCARIR